MSTPNLPIRDDKVYLITFHILGYIIIQQYFTDVFVFRLHLAAMHFNEIAHCTQATSSSGKSIYKTKFTKAKKGVCTAKPVKTGPTYSKFNNIYLLCKNCKRTV